jgi:hypothetical protein
VFRLDGAFIPLVCLALAAATLAIYFQTHAFHYLTFDDNACVYNNPRVRRGITLSGIRRALTALYINWHPLTWLSLMLDMQPFGLNPGLAAQSDRYGAAEEYSRLQ